MLPTQKESLPLSPATKSANSMASSTSTDKSNWAERDIVGELLKISECLESLEALIRRLSPLIGTEKEKFIFGQIRQKVGILASAFNAVVGPK